MTMEVGEKSKRDDDDSPVSTATSLTCNDEGTDSNLKNINDNEIRDDSLANKYPEGNDPASEESLELRKSPSRSDAADEEDGYVVDKVDGVSNSPDKNECLKIPRSDCDDSNDPAGDIEDEKDKQETIVNEKVESKNDEEKPSEIEEKEENESARKSNSDNSSSSRGVISEPVTPQQPLTFTINFDDEKEVDTARYRNLFERYNARHRRNLSTSKVEIKNKQLSDASVLSPNFNQRQKAPSTHSEGYFSSDQEDDTRRRADQLSKKLKQLGLKSSSKVPAVPEKYDVGMVMSKSYSEQSTRYKNDILNPAESSISYNTDNDKMKSSKDVHIPRSILNRGNMSLDLENSANNMIRRINDDNNIIKKQNKKTINAYNNSSGIINHRHNGTSSINNDTDIINHDYELTENNSSSSAAVAVAERFQSSKRSFNSSENNTNRYERSIKTETTTVMDKITNDDREEFDHHHHHHHHHHNYHHRRRHHQRDYDDSNDKLSSGSSENDENFGIKYSNHHHTMRSSRDDYNKPNRENNLDKLEVSNFDDGSDEAVSEAGTYTIHKDYTDEEKARMDIDRIFNVGVVTEQESSEAYVHSFKMCISRDNDWISEWATQVAEHNSLPSAIAGMEIISKGLISPQSPKSPSKIPSPLHSRSRRLSRGRQDQSDSSLEMESYLRAKAATATSPSMNNDRILVDSGGESDDDTSRSHNTPPQSLQRVGSARRSSLSDVLFSRNNMSDGRRSARNYTGTEARLRKERIVTLQEPLRSPTHVLARLQLERRNSSLDRKEYASDTPESNCTSGRSSVKNYLEGTSILPGSPVHPRVKINTSKLTTNSPILSRKEIAATKTSDLAKTPVQAKNIGYFTCTENSPYMLRKSNSTASYGHKENFNHRERSKEPCLTSVQNLHQNSPVPRRSTSIQRSSSNASVRNPQVTSILLARRSSFSSNNNTLNDRNPVAAKPSKFNAASDSSSEAGDKPIPKSPIPPVSSGIKLNRAFSIRRARLNNEYETTPTSTPEERRKKAQVIEPRGGQVSSTSGRQTSSHHHRGRSVGNAVPSGKDTFKRPEQPKPRAPSMSRTDSGRISTRTTKNVNHTQHSRTNQKPNKDVHKKPGRSNSTLTSKEVEFQNWKRRKNYDPMKAAAQGKKKLDTSKKQHSIEDSARGCESSVLRSASFHGTGGTLTLAADWSDNDNEFSDSNEYIRPPPPSSPQLGSDSDFETSSYLRTTENVVSAMSARMIVRHPPPVDSGGESDEDTSRSLHRPAHRGSLHPSRGSDTESSDEPRQPIVQSPVANSNHGKALPSSCLRKSRIDPRDKKVSTTVTKPRSSPRDNRGTVDTTRVVARTDSGRFSTRGTKNANAVGQQVNQSKIKDNKKSLVPSSKELEMQNWKRRKSYDPMKAAMEGRRKVNQTKRSPTDTNLSPSHVLRSQSFHGSVGLGVSDWSDEELTVSADEASMY